MNLSICDLYFLVMHEKNERFISSFHLRSVGNFLKYYNELSEKSKISVENKIRVYLNICNSLEECSSRESLEMFQEYIIPVSEYYVRELKFGVKTEVWVMIIMLIGLGILLYLINNIFTYIASILFISWYARTKIDDFKNDRFFGYGY